MKDIAGQVAAIAVSSLALCASAVVARTPSASEVVFEAPRGAAFGGIGFQNAEAEITALMPDDFRDQRVLKSFREISPTFSRVYAAFADCPREQADRFADYYDATFRAAGTELYAVGGMMPFVPEDETEAYAEKVAASLAYLVKVRGCTNIRYYCMTNELGIDGQGDWYFNRMERFRQIHAALRAAFDRHGLRDIGLAATDVNQHVRLSLRQLDWATKNMDDITSIYCTHWYMFLGQTKDGKSILPSSPENAATMRTHFSSLVAKAAEKGKRYFVGEFGLWTPSTQGANRIMHDDTGYPLRAPEHAADGVITLAEIALTAMNEGAYAAASWSFVDYPDPFVFEPGDTPEEDAVYQSARCVYWPDRKYNKWGMFRWDSVDRDYGAYPSLYTMGWMAKLFRRGARVVKSRVSDDTLRACGVTNPDGSASFAVINWGEAKTVSLVLPQPLARPLRVYEYDSARPPVNAFNDLQPAKGTVTATNGIVSLAVPAKSMTFLTTDYENHVPAAITDIRISDGKLGWSANEEPEHCYYRVYKDGKQIASTVATSLDLGGSQFTATASDAINCVPPVFAVTSVDRWGNEGRCAARRQSDTIKRQHAKGR